MKDFERSNIIQYIILLNVVYTKSKSLQYY